MARDDWTTKRWSASQDPTGVLSSYYSLLMTTVGATVATVADLLQKIPASDPSVGFNLSNYKVSVDYAWPRDGSRLPGELDEYRLWARSSNIQATGVTNFAVQNGYALMWRYQSLSGNTATLNLERWSGGNVTVLATTTFSGAAAGIFEKGKRHNASLRVTGTNPNFLKAEIDGDTYFDYSDATLVTDQQPGLSYTGTGSLLESQSGVYVSNFVVSQLEGSMATSTWSPAEMPSLTCWYLTTLGVGRNTSNEIDSWADQKAPANSMTSDAANKPSWSPNQAAGIGMVQLGGSDNMTAPDSADLDFTNPAAIAFIVKPDSETDHTSVVIYKGSDVSANGQYGAAITTDGTPEWSVKLINGTNSVERGPIVDLANYHIVVSCYATTGQTDGYIRIDGQQIGALHNLEIGATNNDTAWIGRGHVSNSEEHSPRITVGEILVQQGYLTAGDAERVEGYLAWRYGLQSVLPGGHTYKNNPP